MFIGHLPAGYLINCTLVKRLPLIARHARRVMVIALVGAVAPDFDLFWCYLIDSGQRHHHLYPSHWPLLWFTLLAATLLWAGVAKNKLPPWLGVIFCLNGIVHLLLDTLVGDIWWLMPFVNKPFALFHITAVHQPWWLNFLLHWSFLLELILVTAAIAVWCKRNVKMMIVKRVKKLF